MGGMADASVSPYVASVRNAPSFHVHVLGRSICARSTTVPHASESYADANADAGRAARDG